MILDFDRVIALLGLLLQLLAVIIAALDLAMTWGLIKPPKNQSPGKSRDASKLSD